MLEPGFLSVRSTLISVVSVIILVIVIVVTVVIGLRYLLMQRYVSAQIACLDVSILILLFHAQIENNFVVVACFLNYLMLYGLYL